MAAILANRAASAEASPVIYDAMSLIEPSSASVTADHVTDAVFAAPVWVFTVMSPRNNVPSARSPRTRVSFQVLLSTANCVKPFMVALLSLAIYL
jgi:hypothetical protein